MRSGLLILASLALLASCSMEVPSFLGRGGDASQPYQLNPEPPPDPVPVPLHSVELERALHGVIVRAEGIAPTQGFYSAELMPTGAGTDAAGIASFELVAMPPAAAPGVGPERTRVLTAAVFLPTLSLKDLRGFRVAGAGNVRTLPLR